MLTAFTWGYYGWGNHTRDFVSVVDEIERARQRKPPLFVDIRWSRSVRATGFSGNAFEKTVGSNRYKWMKELGNRNIGSSSRRARIADPRAAEELLDLIIDAAKQNRRVLFFCACGLPHRYPIDCHRSKVANLLLKAASKRHRALSILEWPGKSPQATELAVEPKTIKKILRGGNRIALPELRGKDRLKFLSLPWCSRVELRSLDQHGEHDGLDVAVIAGPAQLAAAGWYLPVIGQKSRNVTDTLASIKKEAAQIYKSRGYSPR